jgi:hypothetical protein
MGQAVPPTELWTLRRGKDAAQCVASTHPLGVELRYVMNRHPLISRVFDSWEGVTDQARLWREGLESRGWDGNPRQRLAHSH